MKNIKILLKYNLMEITINTQEIANELKRCYEQELTQIAIRYHAGVIKLLSTLSYGFAQEVNDLIKESESYKKCNS